MASAGAFTENGLLRAVLDAFPLGVQLTSVLGLGRKCWHGFHGGCPPGHSSDSDSMAALLTPGSCSHTGSVSRGQAFAAVHSAPGCQETAWACSDAAPPQGGTLSGLTFGMGFVTGFVSAAESISGSQ